MRALSIMQPWAWLIVAGLKDVENRTWWTAVRGEVLVHAGKTVDRDAMDALTARRHPVTGRPWLARALPAEFARGAIVGAVTITDCVTASPSEWFTGPQGFCLARPVQFQPLPWRGQLGFFEIDADAVAQLRPLGEAAFGQGGLF
jgi:ASCH domain.